MMIIGEASRPSSGSSQKMRRKGTLVEGEERDNSNVENKPPTEVEIGVAKTFDGERLVLKDRTDFNTNIVVRELLKKVQQQRAFP